MRKDNDYLKLHPGEATALEKAKKAGYIVVVLLAVFFLVVLLLPDIYLFKYDRMLSATSYDVYEGSLSGGDLSGTLAIDGETIDVSSERVADPGTYRATHSFTNEPAGVHAIDGWTTANGSQDPRVLDDVVNHSKVIDIENSTICQDMVVSTGNGFVIEFWARFYGDSDGATFFSISSQSGTFFSLSSKLDLNMTKITVRSEIQSKSCEHATGRWLRFSLSWYRPSSSVRMSVNDAGYDDLQTTSIDSIRRVCFNDSLAVIDAVGYSWDSSYSVGENREAAEQFSIDMEVAFVGIDAGIEGVSDLSIRSAASGVSASVFERSFSIRGNGGLVRCESIANGITWIEGILHVDVRGEKTLIIDGRILLIMSIRSSDRINLSIDLLEMLVTVLV